MLLQLHSRGVARAIEIARNVLSRMLGGSSKVAAAAVVLVGLLLLSDAATGYVGYALHREQQFAASPLPYGSRLRVPPGLPRVGLAALFVAVDGARTCRVLQRVNVGALDAIVLVGDNGGRLADSCRPVASSHGVLIPVGTSSVFAERGGALRRGFVVTDSAFRVIYGSSRAEDLLWVPRVLSLMRGRRQ
jgi:hypothetical protein